MSALMQTYARLPVTFSHGEGVYLYDSEGRRYLDGISGIAVNSLGHAHPAVSAAIREQADKLIHTSNLYQVEAQEMLAGKLAEVSGMETCFFGNSGAEANEAAIKLARLYGHGKGIENPAIIVMENSFHGRTLATLSATGNRKVQAGFEPLVNGFVRVPYDDIAAIQTVAENRDDIVAVLVEPIQGEGGVNIPSPEYLGGLRGLCNENGWLLMLDEIQTGIGRTGEWFAFQHTGITPDVMTLAKALGNGVPIGACLAAESVADVLQPGSHGSTFGGNPLACRAALAVLKTINTEYLHTRARELGLSMLQQLRDDLKDAPGVLDIRGHGLMIGIELDQPCAGLVVAALERHSLLINVTAENVIRLLPPLIISDEEAIRICTGVADLVRDLESAAA